MPRDARQKPADAAHVPRNRQEFIHSTIREKGYQSYLEIGCGGNRTFDSAIAPHKVGVEPKRGGTLRLTSASPRRWYAAGHATGHPSVRGRGSQVFKKRCGASANPIEAVS